LQGAQVLKMVINWAQQNLTAVKTVDMMVDKACMSRRNFDRQFKLAMGLSAKAWLTEQRLERAKSYLKFSNLDIDEIAEVSGFGTYPNLRNCFTRKLGQTPNSYRILSRVQ
jgi:AraC family transcriptional activator FtrA